MSNKLLYIAVCACMAAIGLLPACKKDNWGKDNVTTITTAVQLAPDNNASVVLDTLSNAVVSFEWQPSTTGNFTPVYYKVVFDKEGGDFSRPLYTGVPASLGWVPKLAVSHKVLNKMAVTAAIPVAGKGKLSWKVIASNGVVAETSGTGRLIEVQRQ
jgi:starch-binding outer membrane protein SusE/F